MHQWWASVPEWAKPVTLSAAIAAALAIIGWLLAKGLPAIARWRRERKAGKCRNKVADALRPMRDFGLTEAELITKIPECSSQGIEQAIRFWEEKGLVRPASQNRWVWQPSRIYRS